MDIAKWAARIDSLGLPVVPVRSKSSGAHGFSFFDQAILIPDAIALMSSVTRRLGLPDTTEIFPLDRARPQGINVPYLGYSNEIFERQVGIRRNGSEIGLPEFVRLCERMTMSANQRAALLHNAPRPQPRGRPRGGGRALPVVPQVVPPEIIELLTKNAGRGVPSAPEDMQPPEDTELKIQFALDAIPIPLKSYHFWVRVGGMIACALRGRVEDDGRGLWEEWSGPREDKTNKCDDFRWKECMGFTEFERDGRSIFWLADKNDPERLWRRAYQKAHDDMNRGNK